MQGPQKRHEKRSLLDKSSNLDANAATSPKSVGDVSRSRETAQKQVAAMQSRKLAGPGAGVRKYDILTALGAYALASDRNTQRRLLRLMTLITARYNWQRDELSIGRTEIAALWSVDERTVKRDIGALKAMGFLIVKRPAARGRVTLYGLDLTNILSVSEGTWSNVGSDFLNRMSEMKLQDRAPGHTVIQFPGNGNSHDLWGRVLRRMQAEDPARAHAWFQPMQLHEHSDARLVLKAPTRFHADYVTTHMAGEILRAVGPFAPEVTEISVITA